MLVDDELLRGTTAAGSRGGPLRPSASRRRSTRCSPRGSTACRPTSAAISSERRSRGRCSTAARSSSSRPTRALRRSTRVCMALVRRDLIRPDSRAFAGDEAYRFRHLLIRDAAYGRFRRTRAPTSTSGSPAGWSGPPASGCASTRRSSATTSSRRTATGPRSGRADEHAARSRKRAATRLEAAGRRALARSDLPAAIGLLERVRVCSPSMTRDVQHCFPTSGLR